MAFSIAGTFFLKADHCSAVKLIPDNTNSLLTVGEGEKLEHIQIRFGLQDEETNGMLMWVESFLALGKWLISAVSKHIYSG